MAVSNLTPAIANVFAEFAKVGHPFPAGNNAHDAAEAVLLNNNRHATCADCHNGHASQSGEHLPTAADYSRVAERRCRNQCDRRHIHRRSVSQPIRKLSALPRHELGESCQSRFRISADKSSVSRRSAKCHPAVRRHGHVEPSGDPHAQQSTATAEFAKHAVGFERRHDPRSSHGQPDILHRLPQQRRQSRIWRHWSQRSAWLSEQAHPGTRL